MIPINSSSISGVDYNALTKVFIVCFNNGGEYIFYNFPESVFNDFMTSPSKGAFFNNHIKGKYKPL